jgi:hypothetical protein
MNDGDVMRMQRGMEILSEVFLRAGATKVMPMAVGCEEIDGEEGLAKLRKMRLRAGDFEVSAFHPLGTCRMGTDPARSCVGPDGAAHDVAGLWVADGSTIPSSLGVNPQMTIMALALRSAEAIDARLDALASTPPRTERKTTLSFDETMSGTFRLVDDRATRRPLSIALHVEAGRSLTLSLSGRVMAEGFGARCPGEGTLAFDVLRGRLAYDFLFDADDARRYRFKGHKRLRFGALRQSMTTLRARIHDDTGKVVADAKVTFDLERDLVEFVKSFRVRGSV